MWRGAARIEPEIDGGVSEDFLGEKYRKYLRNKISLDDRRYGGRDLSFCEQRHRAVVTGRISVSVEQLVQSRTRFNRRSEQDQRHQ